MSDYSDYFDIIIDCLNEQNKQLSEQNRQLGRIAGCLVELYKLKEATTK